MLFLNDFKPLTLGDRDTFLSHYRHFPLVHSDNSFAGMASWNHYANYEYVMTERSLIVASTVDSELSLRGPFGPASPRLLDEVLVLAAKEGGKRPYYIFDSETKKLVSKQYPDLILHPDRDFFDYVYQAEDLAELPGKKYLGIRRHINKFKRKCAYTMEHIGPENIDDVGDFLLEWCEWKHCDENSILSHEKDAVNFALLNFFELGLSGLIVRVDESISAIAVFEELNPDTVVVHFEKGLPDCEGNYKFVNQQTAMLFRDKYQYINRESDLGLAGLREAKLRYHPDHFAEVYYIEQGELNEVL